MGRSFWLVSLRTDYNCKTTMSRMKEVNSKSGYQGMNERKIAVGYGHRELGQGDILIPGLANEITIEEIAPKLPWNVFHILSSVSPAWRRAIQSRQIFNARQRSGSLQNLLVLSERYRPSSCNRPEEMDFLYPNESIGDVCLRVSKLFREKRKLFNPCKLDSSSRRDLLADEPDIDNMFKFAIYLYSMEEDYCYHLPPIVGLNTEIPYGCGVVCMSGRIYILGGSNEKQECTREVYVLDLAGQQKWKQCASMAVARSDFGCGVIDGKIYVFGGTSKAALLCEGEVYDSALGTWSPIADMWSYRGFHEAVSVGEEFLIYDGLVFNSDFLKWHESDSERLERPMRTSERPSNTHRAAFAEIYNPRRDEWRTVEGFGIPLMWGAALVTVDGKLHKMDKNGIHVYDLGSNLWTHSQSFSHQGLDLLNAMLPALSLNGEILAFVSWAGGRFLLRSKGLGHENREITWQNVLAKVPNVEACLGFSQVPCLNIILEMQKFFPQLGSDFVLYDDNELMGLE